MAGNIYPPPHLHPLPSLTKVFLHQLRDELEAGIASELPNLEKHEGVEEMGERRGEGTGRRKIFTLFKINQRTGIFLLIIPLSDPFLLLSRKGSS